MRLTHLKLAGFKSFVDPTTLHIHGQRVGVVGPNGCGKSNVMESVRWVLGESSAKEMRGDSMDAVIFNGSGNRKPISRASVELIFDNSLGTAAGEWSQYAEISVKRVIERDKGSSYFINNTSVRRRDVADLFLGTGLGGRAYAIIGQNTISRIVEAKPEELRVFLEEAAGISKYKERRRETELRLRDTRENLIRIEDIRREMEKQITRLESQAQVTMQYHQFNDELKLLQGQLWLLKKRDASGVWEKSQRQVEKLVNDLEFQMAALRKTESQLETLRQQNYASAEAVQVAQTQYYETNADVSNLENQVKNTQEARERLIQQIQQIVAQTQKIEAQQGLLITQLQQLQQQQLDAETRESGVQATLLSAKAALPQAMEALQLQQRLHNKAQATLTETEQNIRVETTNLTHIQRTLTELAQRIQRLASEQTQLQLPDVEVIKQKQSALDVASNEISVLEKSSLLAQQQEHTLYETIKSLRADLLNDDRQLAQINAQITTLTKIQASLGHEAKLDQWLKTAQLEHLPRFWQVMRIETGWETALEAVLGARLNAVLQSNSVGFKFDTRPPASLVVLQAIGESDKLSEASKHANWKAMVSAVQVTDDAWLPLVQSSLADVYLLENEVDITVARAALKHGELLVNALGDIYSHHGVVFHAAQSALHGVLERQNELDTLHNQLPELNQQHMQKTEALQQTEQRLKQAQQDYQAQQHALKTQTQIRYNLNLEIQRLQQQHQHVLDRQKTLVNEQAQLQEKDKALQVDFQQKQRVIGELTADLPNLSEQRKASLLNRQQAESALNLARDALQKAERLVQEEGFGKKLISNNINEVNNKINTCNEESISLLNRKNEAESLLEAAKMEGLKANLEAALNLKQQREMALAEARNAMASAEQELQTQERNRMQNEQLLHPLRDKLEQARLQEQQARLYFEQCQAGLEATGLNENDLMQILKSSSKVNEIEQQATSVQSQIEALGAVNLAAIQELASEKERKSYLDSQALDLEQAIATLEDAIHRIDKETRTRLQHTFDEANRHFGELFATLFGGGQAKLELLGDEILDTGMQVFAQPPGKKNSTIHLLSGGEKALTALALVFALFKLNPAPFCLMDEVDAPLDDSNTERFCNMVRKMSERTQFMFVSHNKITMEMAQQLIGVTMQESGVSRIVEVDIDAAMEMQQQTLV
ncbi:MAG TPA: chromosome segregation protein SMC [Methylophilaceae bacterium]